MGLERSSVVTRRNCTVMGLSRLCCSGLSLSWTAMLTTGVLMTGRFGTLAMTREVKPLHQSHRMVPIPAPPECLPQAPLVGVVALW